MARDQGSGQEQISNRLIEAIEALRKDVTRVEIWAAALGSFSQPVPDYAPDSRFMLGGRDGEAKKHRKKAPDSRAKKPARDGH